MLAQEHRRIGKERHPMLLQMIAEGKTMPQISEVLGVSQEHIRRWAKRRGVAIARHVQQMERHPKWKGGDVWSHGYLMRRVPLDSEWGYLIRCKMRGGKPVRFGYAAYHRIVMHNKLGRPLAPGEVVDHIDFDTTNNHPENLRVFPSNGEHIRATLKGRVPKWTPEGFARITGRPKKTPPQPPTHEANGPHSRTDVLV